MATKKKPFLAAKMAKKAIFDPKRSNLTPQIKPLREEKFLQIFTFTTAAILFYDQK